MICFLSNLFLIYLEAGEISNISLPLFFSGNHQTRRYFTKQNPETKSSDQYMSTPSTCKCGSNIDWQIKLSSHEQCLFGNEYLSQKL